MRKNYITPCWLMLLPATVIFYNAYRVVHLGAVGLMRHRQRGVPPYIWLLLILIEAILYWRIRKVNIYRKDSLTHIFLFAFAFITPYLREWIFEAYDDGFTFGLDVAQFVRLGNIGQMLAFWAALILGHVLFIRLIIKARLPKSTDSQKADPQNLLDDVLT